MTVLIIVTLIIAVEVAALSYLNYRRRKAQKAKPAGEAVSGGAPAEGAGTLEGTKDTEAPVIKIPGTNPIQELTKLPEVADSSTLPEEAKSILMNAVWYRCENSKCNYTQFLEVYHIVPEEKDGTNSLDNLIVLCPRCRFDAYSAELTEDELHSWVKERMERFKFAIDWPYK